MKHTAKNGIRYWTYHDSKKQPVVFIHGFTGSHEGFQYIVPQLPHFYVIVPDLPGFGESPLNDDGWTIEGIAKQTNDFIRSLSLKKKPYLISHSMGTLVAASMLEQAPDLFQKKTVFISPVPHKVRTLDSRKIGAVLGSLQYRLGSMPRIGHRLVKSHRISNMATRFIVTTKDKDFRKTINSHHIKNLLYISDVRFYHRLHKEINTMGVIDKVPALASFKNLLIVGEKDNVTPLKKVRRLKQELDTDLVVMPGVGHLAHYETPELIVKAIDDFLQ